MSAASTMSLSTTPMEASQKAWLGLGLGLRVGLGLGLGSGLGLGLMVRLGLGLGLGCTSMGRMEKGSSICSPSSSMPSRKKVMSIVEGMVIRWFHEGSTDLGRG